MRVLLAVAITLAAALDIGSFYLLGLHGAAEANPLALALGPLAVVAKLALAAALIVAVRRRLPHFAPVGLLAACWWSFGAIVNSW